MHVFGGVLIPEERITNEHWALHLPTLTWSPLTLSTTDRDDDIINNSTSYNLTGVDVGNHGDVTVTTTGEDSVELPLRVRSHTAHVVATTMIAIFGMSNLQRPFIFFVQEYDLGRFPFHSSPVEISVPESGEWSVPVQNGMQPKGRMGHSSVYDSESGMVYVYGGQLGDSVSSDLLVYDPLAHHWSKRERSGRHYLLSLSIPLPIPPPPVCAVPHPLSTCTLPTSCGVE